MSLESLRPKIQWILNPIVKFFAKLPFGPNFWTVLSLVCALAAGFSFGFGQPLLGVIFVVLNACMDVLDGALARYTGVASPIGDYLDHVFDRYADTFIVVGIFAYGVTHWHIQIGSVEIATWILGMFAITGVLLSSYMGTQAQAVGMKRNYGGMLGRADRLILLIIFAIAEIIYPANVLFGLSFLGWLLVIYGLFGHITAIQRFAMGISELNKQGKTKGK